MKSFRGYISENVLPSVQVADGGLDIDKPAVRAAINAAIAGVVSQPAVTPYVVYNRLSKLLAQYHIVLPRKFLEGDKGVEVFELRQFGHKMGMTDGGEFVNEVPSTHYLFLQYGIITPMGVTYAKPVVGGMFRVMARIVDKAELDKLLDMAEITMSEEAECRQNAAKASAPKEPMHDITSDEKKKGNKEAVADSEKGLKEELSHGARELTLHADNDQQLHRSSHQPIVKNLQRKHAKGTYDHEKATKLWKYHADRAAKSYEKQHGGKFSVADRKAAAAHFADSARDEHGFGKVNEGVVTGNRSFKGSADRKRKAVQMNLGRKHKDHPDWNPRTNPQNSALVLGRQLQKQGVKEKTLDETRMPASIIRRKQKLANMSPEEKAKKFAGKSEDELKSMARRHGYGKDSTEYSKHVKEEQLDEISKKTLASYSQKANKETNRNQPSDPNKFRKRVNREKGIKLAWNKYNDYKVKVPATNEETQLDEISDKTRKSYAAKAYYSKSKAEMEKGKAFGPHARFVSGTKYDDTIKKRDKGLARAEKKLEEKAPPGAKFERMVKHIKAGYAKDGLTKKEKSIAYATAWKAKKRQDEETKFDPSTEIPRNS